MYWMVSILLALITQTTNFIKNDYSRNLNEPDQIVPEMIRKNWGELEIHRLTTEDGYGLTMFRIPQRTNPKGVVLLQPALTADSMMWILTGNESLAHHLRLRGYDLWLANQRGTEYSQRHINLSTNSFNYWDFTFHEIGYYDMKTQIDFIRKQTNQKVIVIGHSMSTTSTLIYMSLRPKDAENSVKLFVNLAPEAYLGHFKSPIRIFSPLSKYIWSYAKYLNIFAVKYNNPIIKALIKFVSIFPDDELIKSILSVSSGWSNENVDLNFIRTNMIYFPKSFSMKTVEHYSQFISGRFQMFDYGKTGNFFKYQNVVPPEYPLENIRVPILTVYSADDYMSDSEDVKILLTKIPKNMQFKNIKVSGVNHLDYHIGLNRYEKVYKKILNVLDNI